MRTIFRPKFTWKAWAEHRMEQGSSLENKPDYSGTLDQKTFRSVTRRAVAIPFILIVVFAAFTLWQLASRINDAAWVDHTDRAIALGQEVAFDFANSSANLRGYLLVGDTALLARSQDSHREALEDLKTLAALVSDNPPQVARLESVLRIAAEWKEFADKELELKKTGGDYGALIRSGVTIERMADIQSELAKFASVERDLRTRRSAISGRGNFYSVIFLSAASLFIGGLLALLARRDVETIAAMFETTLQNEAGARAQAEEASRAKDEFLGTVSHELRNPLNSVLMWARALQEGPSNPDRLKRGLEAIERGARSQAEMIEDLIDTARIESGKLRLDVRPIDLAPLIEAAIETVLPAAENKQIRIQSVLDTNTGRVAGDAQRLQQVFWNLLSNAVKFTPKDGRIQVQLERINSHVEVSVSDTGRGIDPTELPRIFERFWQADSATRREYRGLGLGLSIARNILELHGGSISASSDGADKGTTFRVRLPIMIAAELSPSIRRHPTASDGMSTTASTRLDGISVLAVDDERDAGLAIKALLDGFGAEVRIANSADQALLMLDGWTPDVIVSDIGMPGMDGIELMREIRKIDAARGREIPALALTAYGRVDDKIKIIEAGFQAHVIKPVDASELAAVIASLAGRHRAT
jgi:signal transduction histidine kinase/ActR/RegA family two-component response regulator